ncbi:hypothetical protein L1987_16682 [Smallanthus sonchifolius]|uniref:Uncharacterized protein n=1 Tax=Smallanthus sonchifolius TaxID=185202 RepID=A0ACB9IVV9_9ASTR|nr:hypothetical protein L1987_16682 [Smallanthus sonchifolius]
MAQDLSHELANLRCKRRKTYSNPRVHLLFIWFILITTHLPQSSADHHRHDSIPSGQKALFFGNASLQFHPPTRSRPAGEGDLYDEDKRQVHTGPNPLHN